MSSATDHELTPNTEPPPPPPSEPVSSLAKAINADDDDDDDDEGYTGILPDFSEDEAPPNPSTSTTTSKPRLPPSKAPKGPAGRKKIPLSKLKDKLTGASSKKKATVAATGGGGEEERSTKEDGDAITFSESDLDKVMAQFNLHNATSSAEDGGISREDLQKLIQQAGINKRVLQGKQGLMGVPTKDMASHKFWRTQPVTKLGTPEDEIREGPIEANKLPSELRQTPYDLHKDFRWVEPDLNDPEELRELYELLVAGYVEDADATFRFAYTADFIEWALKPAGYQKDWHLGIRVASTGKLVGFIAGVPLDLRIRSVTKRVVEINFLWVHKKLRSQRFTPLLIQEITRRINLRGIFQAIYTSGAFLPTPVSRCQYYHRNLNPKKLHETGFAVVPRNSTMVRQIRHYQLGESGGLRGMREMEKRDLKQVGRLLRAYLARMDLAPLLSNKDIEQQLWAGRGKDVNGERVGQVTWAYVVEDPETHRITDMFSFYNLPSTAVKAKPPTVIKAAYLYYYATTACPSCADLGDGSVATPVTNWKDETEEERKMLKERLKVLMGEALILAQKLQFDAFNALTTSDNELFLSDLKFGRGDGFLHYYLYNYATQPIKGGVDPSDGGSGIGVIML